MELNFASYSRYHLFHRLFSAELNSLITFHAFDYGQVISSYIYVCVARDFTKQLSFLSNFQYLTLVFSKYFELCCGKLHHGNQFTWNLCTLWPNLIRPPSHYTYYRELSWNQLIDSIPGTLCLLCHIEYSPHSSWCCYQLGGLTAPTSTIKFSRSNVHHKKIPRYHFSSGIILS